MTQVEVTSEARAREILPCPFCGGAGLSHRVPTGWRVSCKNCDCRPLRGLPPRNEADAIAAWNTRTFATEAVEADRQARGAAEAGWIVGSADGKRWRHWFNGEVEWVDNREEATRYARRHDAEAVHREDEDAWCVVPYAAAEAGEPIPAGMVRWHGGDAAPEDWDRGPVLLRNGDVITPAAPEWRYSAGGRGRRDIIAYTPRPQPEARDALVERIAEAINTARYVPGGLEPIPLEQEDERSRAYSYRLAGAAVTALTKERE